MNCLIIDDDEMIRLDLETRISKIPFLSLAGSCGSAMEAMPFLHKGAVDLIFLDVMMPEISGLQFLDTLTGDRPQIIIITSEKSHAAEAFDHRVTDFLVKPFNANRFLKSVMNAMEIYNSVRSNLLHQKHLFVKHNGSIIRLETNEILYIEANADYLTIHTAQRPYTIHSTMQQFMTSLPEESFFRVHLSFIVNLEKISKIEDNMIVIGQKLVPLSRSRAKDFYRMLNLRL